MGEIKFKVGDKVRTLKNENKLGNSRFDVGTVGRIINTITNIDNVIDSYQVGFCGYYYWYDEDELELVEDTNADTATKKDFDHKFKVGDKVIVGDSIIGKILDINMKNYTYEVTLYTNDIGWFGENELKIFNDTLSETPNKPCSDVQSNVTVEEVEKLKKELRRKDSELHKMKELIIGLLDLVIE